MTEPHTQPPEGYDPEYTEESPVALDLVISIRDKARKLYSLIPRDQNAAASNALWEILTDFCDIIGDHEAKEIEPGEEPEPPVDEDKMKARQHE